MRRVGLIILCLTLIAPCIFFFACKQNDKKHEITNSTDSIAEFSIITYDGVSESKNMLKNLGHSFLSVKNLSGNDIVVGNYILQPNDVVTFGTWSINDHFGVWYNVETNYIRFSNKYDGRISVSQNINLNELEKISKFILSHDRWNPVNNCSYFAINCWNEIADENEKLQTYLIYKPVKLAKEIKLFSNYKINLDLSTNSKFGYFNNNHFKEFSFEKGI